MGGGETRERSAGAGLYRTRPARFLEEGQEGGSTSWPIRRQPAANTRYLAATLYS